MRLLWCLLASAILHIFTWAAVTRSAHLSLLRNVRTEQPHETVIVSSSSVRIEHRTVLHPPRLRAAPPPTTSLSPPQPASLSLPPGWAQQDYGNKAATDTTLWLDWTKQRGTFVPRVFLWQRKAQAGYMRRPSLQDAVGDVLASLRAANVKIYASKAQQVCRGKRPGWFFSYVKPWDDPPAHIDETLFMAGDTIYRATYIRAAGQPEDTKTREGLNTLCSKG
jgi:hypothetical protein